MRIIRLSAIRLALTTDPAGSTGTVTTNVQPTFTPLGPGLYAKLEESQLPARELGPQLHSVEVGCVDEYESSFKEAVKARSGPLAVSPLASFDQKRIVELAVKNRLPAIYATRGIVDRGSLMVEGPEETEIVRRVAVFVDKILKGVKPSDIPVEQPRKFELAINLTAGKQIGLTIHPKCWRGQTR